MEFSHVGGYCTKCRSYDFLPHQCSLCDKKFCQDCLSFESHSCPHYTTNVQPRERKKKRRYKKHRCDCDDCSSLVFAECKFCKKSYCLTHRLSFAHNCEKDENIIRREKKRSKKVNLPDKDRALRFLNHVFFKRAKYNMKKLEKKNVNEKYKFSNTKETPFSSLLKPDHFQGRLIFGVFYPNETLYQGAFNFFEKYFRVGKILDILSQDSSIFSTDQNLGIYNLRTGEKFKNNLTLFELVQNGRLKMNDVLVLERNYNVEKQIRRIRKDLGFEETRNCGFGMMNNLQNLKKKDVKCK